MTLKEQKRQNYLALLKLLHELERLTVCRLDVANANTMMERSIVRDYKLQTTLEYCSKARPELVQTTGTGYSITMIATESVNEDDPAKDILKLNKVEDIFRAKDIINKAFLSLFPKESQECAQALS